MKTKLVLYPFILTTTHDDDDDDNDNDNDNDGMNASNGLTTFD